MGHICHMLQEHNPIVHKLEPKLRGQCVFNATHHLHTKFCMLPLQCNGFTGLHVQVEWVIKGDVGAALVDTEEQW